MANKALAAARQMHCYLLDWPDRVLALVHGTSLCNATHPGTHPPVLLWLLQHELPQHKDGGIVAHAPIWLRQQG